MSIRPGRGCSLAMCVERRLVATRSPQNLQRAFPGEMWMRCTYEQHERLFAARQARRNATILSRLSSEDRRHSGNRGCFGTSRSETGLIPKNDSPTMGQASRESRGSPTQSSRQLRPLVEDGERSLEPSPGSRPPRLRGVRRVCLISDVEQTTARLMVNHRQFPERATGLDTPLPSSFCHDGFARSFLILARVSMRSIDRGLVDIAHGD